MTPPNVLVTGATGFIGGSVLTQLLSSSNPAIQHLAITALVRKQEHIDTLATKGVKALLFNSLDDAAQLRQIAAQFDIVLHCATGLHTASAEALILGLGDAQKRTGRQTHYIHTTGTSNLAFGTLAFPDRPVQNLTDADDDIYGEEVRRHAEIHYDQRKTDLVVHETAEKTQVKPYLMMPPTVYGRGLGFFNTQSIQLPLIIKRAKAAGHPEYIADGSGMMGYVHVADLVVLYELLLGKILAGEDELLPSGRRGYYFSNTGEYTWKGVNETIGAIGVRLGALASGTPVSIPLDVAAVKWGFGVDGTLMLENNFAARSRTIPKNAQLLGWKPQRGEDDWQEELEESWKAVLAGNV